MPKVEIDLDDLNALLDAADVGAGEISRFGGMITAVKRRLRKDHTWADHDRAEREVEVRAALRWREMTRAFVNQWKDQLVWLVARGGHGDPIRAASVMLVTHVKPTRDGGLVAGKRVSYTIDVRTKQHDPLYEYEIRSRRDDSMSAHVTNLVPPDALPFPPEDVIFGWVKYAMKESTDAE